ncbi:hypothetical protein G6L68_10250 [Agrobacterium fabrum]|uniref:hypothetical protein n=1 Tax=Agrobacterium fabrum TaxID=1176649 RepID=UPI000F0C3929|nr:hypothetical protein [Agrobacterium fabrum]AYM62925.1 hypothetical protein At12D13_17600 [Agrobacterium fabrum]NTE61024.1 hypothetical protein [Agrobacterium fabrum]
MTDNENPHVLEMRARLFPELAGLRYNGYRWVDAEHPEPGLVPVIAPPKLEMFVGVSNRKPPRPQAKKTKKRRRGGF